MLISVVICTYNRSVLLTGALESVFQQKPDPALVEVIVVDNNSSDDTAEVIASFARRFRQLRRATESRQGLSHARNRGWKLARGEYVAYIDDDCRVPTDWLGRAQEIIRNSRADVFGGPYFPLYQSTKPDWFLDDYGSWQPAVQAGDIEPAALHGGNLFIRRALLPNAGGFSSTLGMRGKRVGYGEETDLLLRLQTRWPTLRFYYDPALYVDHLVRPEKMSILWCLHERFKRGRAVYHVRNLHSRQAADRRNQLVELFKLAGSIAWSLTARTLLRNRRQYPLFQNYWHEQAFRDLRILGIRYEHYRVSKRRPKSTGIEPDRTESR